MDFNKLNDWVAKQDSTIGKITELGMISGGYSNLTYLLIDEYQNEYVLRRPPEGALAKGGHDMVRESDLLLELEKCGFSLSPKVILQEKTAEVLGVPFFIMMKKEGNIIRPGFKNGNETIFRQTSELLVESLAQLHLIEVNATGLMRFGKPEGYLQRQVNAWIDRYQKSKTDEIAEMEQTAAWLLQNRMDSKYISLIHNDFKYDNVVFASDFQSLSGILDWEMATVGDPLMDLGVALAWWFENDDNEFTKTINITWQNGCLTRKEVIELYRQKTGFDLTNIVYYYVFGLFKNAVIAQQIYGRWLAGASQDPRFSKMIMGVKELSKMAVKAFEKDKI